MMTRVCSEGTTKLGTMYVIMNRNTYSIFWSVLARARLFDVVDADILSYTEQWTEGEGNGQWLNRNRRPGKHLAKVARLAPILRV